VSLPRRIAAGLFLLVLADAAAWVASELGAPQVAVMATAIAVAVSGSLQLARMGWHPLWTSRTGRSR
jgi:hypothetical protein